jgi:alpha-beta hydrolase superfamily lysophospholipase
MTRVLAALMTVAVLAVPSGHALQAPSTSTGWAPDDHVSGFWYQTIPLRDDYDGKVSATLVRRPKERLRNCAVLYLHGWADYFFQAHLADFYETVRAPGDSRRGCDFFALDLRKYGRSLPVGYKYPNFAKDLDEYFEEITFALALIEHEGYSFVLLNGHSTGALIAARYLQNGDKQAVVDAAFLNSPFLGFNDRDVTAFGERVARFVGRIAPHASQKSPIPLWYARSLLRPSDDCPDCHGRWEFHYKRLKPIAGFPVYLGWIRAIAIAQDRVLRGGIRQPILILHSARSNKGREPIWHEEYRRSDLVLDVADIRDEGRSLGSLVSMQEIEGGVHDLVLSDPDAQGRVFDAVTAWLAGLPANQVRP